VDVNEAFEREFGITKQEAVGKTAFELGINPDDEVKKQILEALNVSGSVHNQEMVLYSKSGEKRYYETNIEKVVIRGEEYLLNTTQNISEYKSAKRKLKES
jgi:PAS domain S-box-containing protein